MSVASFLQKDRIIKEKKHPQSFPTCLMHRISKCMFYCSCGSCTQSLRPHNQTDSTAKINTVLWKRSVGQLNSGKATADRHTNIWLIKTVCNQVKCKTEFAKATDEQVALMALRWSPLFFCLCLSTWLSRRLCCLWLTTGLIYDSQLLPDAQHWPHRGRRDLNSRLKWGGKVAQLYRPRYTRHR